MHNIIRKGKACCHNFWKNYKEKICGYLFIILVFIMIPAAVGGYENEEYGFFLMAFLLMLYGAAAYFCYGCIKGKEAL